ncbi:hypothetical protein BO70DRAFT_428983 [Aspergillus heteromorphus CBS 117.55]|uniref:Zn(2)-C6 fungal-type domain-containing protein n=1 Tax=Aspergillus heteromorphus CBS 117.55 TaxID=1448321 RepID=A0A317W9S5_9EURO|nr:uncharacterized protein BO70DRAFT_428983 [Aspergillus heteromorphus CBS 117.55]PWY82919.1 hypothetical protein BO70DRAFT_428983 [Aspergillus heteromorphus CBS 117.55]
MAPAKTTSKVSRITVACNSCRFRKQKCSGNKPICTQCHQHNRPCDWPEQLKRGPAKGYIEALEQRLHETESLLLKLLSDIPDSHLLSATVPDTPPPHTYTSPLRLGAKRGTDYWKRFPLHTVRDIRDWQQDCLNQREPSRGPESVKQHYHQHQHHPSISVPVSLPPPPDTEPLRDPQLPIPEFNDRHDPSPDHLPGIHHLHHIETTMSHSPEDASGLSSAKVSASGSPTNLEPERETRPRIDPVFEAIQYQNARRDNLHDFGNSVQQKQSLWKGAPAVNFQQQQQFLW